MAYNTESHEALRSSRKIRILSFASDNGGLYQTYSCTLEDREKRESHVYIHVDHLKNRITLGHWSPSKVQLLAVLNGETKTLEHIDIHSMEETHIGRLHLNTVVGDATNSAIMECVTVNGEVIIRDSRTHAILARLDSGERSNPSKVKTFVYTSEAGRNADNKILILLLVFKMFKDAASCPRHLIPSSHYSELDELATVRNISIAKCFFKSEDKTTCDYFAVLDMCTLQHLLTFKVCDDEINGSRLHVFDCKGQTLFTAAPLVDINDETKVFVNKTTEIGYTRRYTLCAESAIGEKAQLRADGKQLPHNPRSYYNIRRRFTGQDVATITPDSATSPRRVVVNIHPAVDNVHIALFLTFAMKLFLNRYRFHTDYMTEKRSLPQTATEPVVTKRYKAATSLSAESSESSLTTFNPAVTPITPAVSVNVGASTSRDQPSEEGTLPSHIHPSNAAYYTESPLHTAQPVNVIQRHPNILQQHFAGLRYPGQQLPHTRVGGSAGHIPSVNPPINIVQQTYANLTYQNYQSISTGRGAFGSYSQLLHTTQPAYGGQMYQHAQTPYHGQGTYAGQRHQHPQSRYTGEEANDGQNYKDPQSTYTDASWRQPRNQ